MIRLSGSAPEYELGSQHLPRMTASAVAMQIRSPCRAAYGLALPSLRSHSKRNRRCFEQYPPLDQPTQPKARIEAAEHILVLPVRDRRWDR